MQVFDLRAQHPPAAPGGRFEGKPINRRCDSPEHKRSFFDVVHGALTSSSPRTGRQDLAGGKRSAAPGKLARIPRAPTGRQGVPSIACPRQTGDPRWAGPRGHGVYDPYRPRNLAMRPLILSSRRGCTWHSQMMSTCHPRRRRAPLLRRSLLLFPSSFARQKATFDLGIRSPILHLC